MQSIAGVVVLVLALVAATATQATPPDTPPPDDSTPAAHNARFTVACFGQPTGLTSTNLYKKPELLRALKASSDPNIPYLLVVDEYPAATDVGRYFADTQKYWKENEPTLIDDVNTDITNLKAADNKVHEDEKSGPARSENTAADLNAAEAARQKAQQSNDRLVAAMPISPADQRFILNSILLNAMQTNYAGSESQREDCSTLGSAVTAGGLAVATIMQIVKSGAGTMTLYDWAIIGVIPIMALDVTGDTNARPLYLDSAEGLRVLHERYIALYTAIPSAKNLALPATGDIAAADNCSVTLNMVESYFGAGKESAAPAGPHNSRAGAGKTAPTTSSDIALDTLRKTDAILIAGNLKKACASYIASREALAEFTDATTQSKDLVASLMAQDALALDDAVMRRERLTRPAPHDVPGLILGAPIKAITTALTGGNSYSYSAGASLWADKDITLQLHSLALPTLPANYAIDQDIKMNLDALRSTSSLLTDDAGGEATNAARLKACLSPPALVDCQVDNMVALDKSLTAASASLNAVLKKARSLQKTFNTANNQTEMEIRIGSITPVTLKAAPQQSGAPSGAQSATDGS